MADDKANGVAAAQKGPDTMTKVEAVRQAVTALGKKAKAAQIQAHVKEKFGIEVSQNHIYSCLSDLRKGAGKKGAAKPQAKKASPTPAPAAAQTKPTPVVRTAKVQVKPVAVLVPVVKADGIELKDIELAKGLVERVGPKQLQALIELLAK